MDFNEYALEMLVRERLEILRAAAAQRRLTSMVPSVSLRARVGRVLMRFGAWLVSTAPRPTAHDVAAGSSPGSPC